MAMKGKTMNSVFSRSLREHSGRRVVGLRETLFGVLLGFIPCSPAPGQPQEGGASARDLQAAARILDDNEWHLQDAAIQALRASGDPGAAARVRRAVRRRELSATQAYIEATTSKTDRLGALVRWTGHDNVGVAALAANQLLRDDAWDRAGLISQRMVAWDFDTQIYFLQNLLAFEPRAEIHALARLLVEQLLHGDPTPDRGGFGAALALCLLAGSPKQSDRDLAEQLVMRFPEEPLVWVAVSRGEPTDALIVKAQSVYNGEGPEGLRAAAGLVIAKREPSVYDQLMNWIMDYLEDFASPDFAATVLLGITEPSDPAVRKMYRRLAGNQPLLAVLRELPDEMFRQQAARLAGYHYGIAGSCVATILSKRAPKELVQFWNKSDKSVPHELYGALFLAARAQPTLAPDVAVLVPEAQRAKFQQQAHVQDRSFVGLCLYLTLWD